MFILQKGTPHDEIVGQSNQPMIVVLYDVVDNNENMYYIMIEQELLLDTRSFNEAIYLLLAVHYVFNLEYNTVVHEVMLFLQEFVCLLKSKTTKHSAVYTSITSRLFRESKKFSQQETAQDWLTCDCHVYIYVTFMYYTSLSLYISQMLNLQHSFCLFKKYLLK